MKNILCATDDNYAHYCGIMLTSLFENNQENQIRVYVVTGGLNNLNKNTLLKLASAYSQVLEIITVDNILFKDCPIDPIKDHVSIATYYRLAVSMLLPKSIDKVLYLDCDMIICRSIRELYDTDLTGFACGVVNDEAYMTDVPYDRLEQTKDLLNPYFNAGMLLINLSYWRENNITEKSFNYISRHLHKLLFHDQDTLNGVLFGLVKYLKPTYNLQTGFLFTSYFADFDPNLQKEIREAISSPVIIHYTGYTKPWQEWSLIHIHKDGYITKNTLYGKIYLL